MAPGLPKGHVVLGYGPTGRFPMFADGKCSIYGGRPRTCRNFECRIFTAAGIPASGDDKAEINQRVRRWRFTYPTALDREQHRAVQAAPAFILEHAASFPGGRAPTNPSQVAILAIKSCEVFL